ncbi:hypothetical protein [Streptomyces avermitilis]|uniref:hypothetical protein n=1 Tax=Streptomyces avermitilis TaxID=33903 RepID=UPI0037F46D2F
MMTAHIPPTTKTSFERFPDFRPYDFLQARKPIQLANHYYAAHLTSIEPKIRAGVINAGVVKIDLLRMQPRLMKVTATVVATLFAAASRRQLTTSPTPASATIGPALSIGENRAHSGTRLISK